MAKKRTGSQRSRLEKELTQAIGQLDEEGLIFLLQQAQILIHNAQVDKLNRELAELKSKKGAKGKRGDGAAPVTAPAPGEVSIEEANDGKTFFLTLGATRKVLSLQEMRQLVRICYAAETKSDALRQLYTLLARERGDILVDTKVGGPQSPLIEALFRAVRSTYRLKGR